jgi:hypothetical protein
MTYYRVNGHRSGESWLAGMRLKLPSLDLASNSVRLRSRQASCNTGFTNINRPSMLGPVFQSNRDIHRRVPPRVKAPKTTHEGGSSCRH